MGFSFLNVISGLFSIWTHEKNPKDLEKKLQVVRQVWEIQDKKKKIGSSEVFFKLLQKHHLQYDEVS